MEAVAIRVHAYQAGGLEAIHEKAVWADGQLCSMTAHWTVSFPSPLATRGLSAKICDDDPCSVDQ